MLKVDRHSRSFSRLDTPSLADLQMLERADLQEFIYNSSDAFFAEIGERLFLLGKEVAPSETVPDRIDLLAMDAEGTAVVIELKRGKHKLHMLQAIAYAGMVSRWDPEEFMRLMSEDQWEELSDFLDVDVEEMNRRQRLLLVAEGFDYALLAGAEWLSEQYGVDIRCAAVTLATDGSAEAQYVALTSIFPAPALAEQAVARGRGPRRVRPPKWGDWEAALTAIENAELREYARRELEGGRENGLQGRALHYRLDEKRRWSVRCRKKFAYVWQRGRFTGDETYWKERLSHPSSVSPVKAGSAVSFKLYTTSDFEAFRRAATVELAEAEWYDGGLPPNEGNPFDEDTEK